MGEIRKEMIGMATKFYYVGFTGKTLVTRGVFTRQKVMDFKRSHLKNYAADPKKADAFYHYIRAENFAGDAGVILDDKGSIVVKWKRTPSVWGAQYYDYRKPF